MGSAATLDFERLLQPIPGDHPTGIDLRTQDPESHLSPYQKVHSDVLDSRGIERDHFFKDPANPDFSLGNCKWPQIVVQATKILAEDSKDLEIAAWLCDGLVRIHGFAGLRDGLRLARQLVEKYWDALYPAGDGTEEGIRTRLKQFDSVLQARRNPCFRVPITAGEGFSELDYELAQQLEKISDAKEKQSRIERGEVSLKRFNDAVRESSSDFWKNLVDDLQESLCEGEKLSTVLKGVCGKNDQDMERAPSFREYTEVLNKVLAVVRVVAGDRLAAAAAPAAETMASQPAGGGSPAPRSQELTRETSLVRLRELAEFFRRTEPHSPISHHLEEAVRWGQMALPELLTELIPDDRARNELFTRIGISVPKQE
jgi:type VI secretion system protein ImpA